MQQSVDERATTAVRAPELAAPRRHIPQLTGVRAMAALWVVSFHFRPEIVGVAPWVDPVVPLMNVGYLGVDLFFILSGFILTTTHLDRMTAPWNWKKALGFLWLRLARVWPLLFATNVIWGAYILVRVMAGEPGLAQGLAPSRLLAHLFLVQGWGTTHHDWNPVDWSISAEWLAYLAFTVLVLLFARARLVLGTRALWVTAVLAVTPLLVAGMAMQDGTDLLWHDGEIVGGMVPLRVLSEFFAGGLVALWVMRRKDRPLPWYLGPTCVFVATAVLLVLIPVLDPSFRPRYGGDWMLGGSHMLGSTESVVVVPLFLLLIGGLAVSRDPLTRLFATRLFVWGGKVSFALYLIHWMWLDGLRLAYTKLGPAAAEGTVLHLVLLVAALAGIVLSAWALYRWVEEPARRSMRSLLPASIKV
jgi:peptidoglycan/LPS O-acetylase OafA/YrhL